MNGTLRNFAGSMCLALELFSFSLRETIAQDISAPKPSPNTVAAESDQLTLPQVQRVTLNRLDIDPADIELIPGKCSPVILCGGGEQLPKEVFDLAVQWASKVESAFKGSEIEKNFSVAVITWANWDHDGCLEAARNRFGAEIAVGAVPSFDEIFLELAKKLEIPTESEGGSGNSPPVSVDQALIDRVYEALNGSQKNEDSEQVRKEVSDWVIEALDRSPVVFISGGSQVVLALMFRIFPEVQNYLRIQNIKGQVLVMGTSAGCAVLGADPVILGNDLGHAAAGSGLSESLVKSLTDLKRSSNLKCVVARPGLGLSLVSWCVDQHHGGPGADGRYFDDDEVTPLYAYRNNRMERFAHLMGVSDTNKSVGERGELGGESGSSPGSGGFGVWEGGALVVTHAQDPLAPLVAYASAKGDSDPSDTVVPAAQYFVRGDNAQVLPLYHRQVYCVQPPPPTQEPEQ